MTSSHRYWISALLWVSAATLTLAQNRVHYPLGPDSKPQEGVPKGEVLHFTLDHSNIFPGTFRDYWIYVPAEYSPDKPACLYVNQDGIQSNAPTVFDNLIAKKEMPVTIGVFVTPGRVRAADADAALDRFNRSLEYDGLGDRYARFLLEELLPEVETKKTSDGRAIHLSKDPNDHAIGGTSSGAICAFTAAWERPDAFRRVVSGIGTYVGLRGGERYSTLIRKFEPKPLRIFLQDGENDLNIYGGDWWMANQSMERSLTFAGYEVNHTWGEQGHSGEQLAALFPDVMRWLWKDWPAKVREGRSKNEMLQALLLPGENWQVAGDGYGEASGLAADSKGEVVFDDADNGKGYKIGADGSVIAGDNVARGVRGQAFGPEGQLHSTVKGIRGRHMVVAHNGNVYATEPGKNRGDAGKIWLVRPNGKKQAVDTGLLTPTGITLSPDQTLLYVAEGETHWVYSYQVQPDGTLQYKQRYYWLHVPDTEDDSGAGGMIVDRDGRLYVATNMGIQVCDQAGRVNAILPLPNGKATDLSFGGANFDTLFVASGDRIYKRKLGARGAYAWDMPNKPAAPRL
jgi:enterochelin esterase-like enzyme